MHGQVTKTSCDVRENRGRDGGRGARDDDTQTEPTRRNRRPMASGAAKGPREAAGLPFAMRGGGWAAATAERSNRVLVARGRLVTDGAGPVTLDRRAKDAQGASKRPFQSNGRRVRLRPTAQAPSATAGGGVIVPAGGQQLFLQRAPRRAG
jgi:hypothetical protein